MHVADQPKIASRLLGAFPSSLANDVAAVLRLVPIAQHSPSERDVGPILIRGQRIRVPSRFYSPVPKDFQLANLTTQQQAVMASIYTRHHDGFVRQDFVGRLTTTDQFWVAPFLLQLVGEYVYQISELILTRLPEMARGLISDFAAENTPFIALTRCRTISYWNTYYRDRFPRFPDYPGYRILNELGLWSDNISPKLLRNSKE